MSGKLSGAERRKRKARELEEAVKSSKVLAVFLGNKRNEQPTSQLPKPQEDEGELFEQERITKQACGEFEDAHDGDEEDTSSTEEINKACNDAELRHNQGKNSHAVIEFMDLGYKKFEESGTPLVDQHSRELMVKMGADAFRYENFVYPKVPCGSKPIHRGMTKNWLVKRKKSVW